MKVGSSGDGLNDSVDNDQTQSNDARRALSFQRVKTSWTLGVQSSMRQPARGSSD